MKLIKFNTDGRWADPNTLIPQIEVEKGDEVEVSDALADLIVANKRGKVVTQAEQDEAAEKEAESEKEAADKKPGKKNPATKDKGNAESK